MDRFEILNNKPQKPENRFIIDGFNLAFRSHFASLKFSGASNAPSGVIYMFYTTLKALKNRFPDFNFYVAWDNEAKEKKEMFAEYKANRDPFRVDLPIQDLKKSLECLNITQVECQGQEADDVIATLVAQADFNKAYIYSNDKDLQQLVRDGKVIVISPKVGKIEEKIYDEEEVKKKWGVAPADLPCFLAFRGDTSDNVPGVARVPSEILASLSDKYKLPGEVYSKIAGEQLTDFQRKSIQDAQNQVILNYSLILLKKDLICVSKKGESNYIKLKEIFDKYEIRKLDPQSYIDLFNADTVFLRRDGPSLKTISMFD